MPHNTGYHQTKSKDDGCPKHRTPLGKNPSLIAKSPERNIQVHAITHEKGSHERSDDFLLYREVHREMLPDGRQYKKINDSHESADVGQLYDSHDRCFGQCSGRRGICRPWRLGIVSLSGGH
jgi:hypothetical protein